MKTENERLDDLEERMTSLVAVVYTSLICMGMALFMVASS